MTWLIIIGVLVLAIGPVFYLLPSKRDKRLAALRASARDFGLAVEISFLPKLDPAAEERVSAGGSERYAKVQCAAYQLAIGKQLALDSFIVQRMPASPSVPVQEVFPGWCMTDPRRFVRVRGEPELIRHLQNALSRLPEDTIAIGFDSRFVACYWLEGASAGPDVVQSMKGTLTALKEALLEDFGPLAE